MELTIKIIAQDCTSRRRLNNLLANSSSGIHHFILNGLSTGLSVRQNMGIEEYKLEIDIEHESTKQPTK